MNGSLTGVRRKIIFDMRYSIGYNRYIPKEGLPDRNGYGSHPDVDGKRRIRCLRMEESL